MARYIVRTIPGQAAAVAAALSGIKIRPLDTSGSFIFVEVPEDRVAMVQALPGVAKVTPDRKVGIAAVMPVEAKVAEFLRRIKQPFGLPRAIAWARAQDAGETKTPTSEAARLMGATQAWEMGVTGKGVKVAVLDTGIDILSPQMPGIRARSFVSGDPAGDDSNGHGTHVATTIAGGVRGSLRGLAPGVTLRPIKCLGYLIGTGSTSDIIRAMEEAARWGADIISMSLGAAASEPPEDDPMCVVIKEHAERGIIYCIAAGNENQDGAPTVGTPGISPEAITVAAVDAEGKVAPFSSRGPAFGLVKPDIAGIGVDLGSSTSGLIELMEIGAGWKTGYISGTSMATPCVAATLALWLELARKRGLTLTPEHIKEILATYGHQKDVETGWGLLRFEWILNALS